MYFRNLLPRNFSPEDLIPGERIIAIVKRHIFYFLKRITAIAILFVVIWGVFIFIYTNLGVVPDQYKDLSRLILNWTLALINIIVVFRLLYLWVDYHFDNIVVTSQRIISVDRHFIYGQTLREIELTKITTITYERNSFLSNMAGYARLIVDSADDGKHIIFDYTPKVEKVRSIIAEATQKMFESRFVSPSPPLDIKQDLDMNNSLIQEQSPPSIQNNSGDELTVLQNDIQILKQKVSLLEEELSKLKRL